MNKHLSLVAISAFTLSACAPQPKMRTEVRAVLQSNAEAKTLAEWKAKGITPEAIFDNVKTAESKNELCAALEELPSNDLALFDHQISNSKLPCQQNLTSQLNEYWDKTRTQFHSKVTLNPTPLPVVEREIDVTTGPTFTRGELPEKFISLTLDDGPHPSRTQRLLDIFADYGVRATYFMVGENAQDMPEIAKSVADAGHTVGSHSWSHRQLNRIAFSDAKDEILNGVDAVATATGTSIPFFRFPYGARNPSVTAFVKKIPMASFLWNMDSVDWKYRDPEVLWGKITTALDREKGGIMLFHDIHEQTVIVMPRLLEELKARGFTVVVFVPKKS